MTKEITILSKESLLETARHISKAFEPMSTRQEISREQEHVNILLTGSAGSGKSTIVNYLLNKPLIKEGRIKNKISLSDANDQEAARIGETTESIQSYPIALANAQGFLDRDCAANSIVRVFDIPGLFDAGQKRQLAYSLALEQVIRKTNHLKLAIVIEYPELAARKAKAFKELVTLLAELLPSTNLDGQNNVVFLFNKLPSELEKRDVIQEILYVVQALLENASNHTGNEDFALLTKALQICSYIANDCQLYITTSEELQLINQTNCYLWDDSLLSYITPNGVHESVELEDYDYFVEQLNKIRVERPGPVLTLTAVEAYELITANSGHTHTPNVVLVDPVDDGASRELIFQALGRASFVNAAMFEFNTNSRKTFIKSLRAQYLEPYLQLMREHRLNHLILKLSQTECALLATYQQTDAPERERFIHKEQEKYKALLKDHQTELEQKKLDLARVYEELAAFPWTEQRPVESEPTVITLSTEMAALINATKQLELCIHSCKRILNIVPVLNNHPEAIAPLKLQLAKRAETLVSSLQERLASTTEKLGSAAEELDAIHTILSHLEIPALSDEYQQEYQLLKNNISTDEHQLIENLQMFSAEDTDAAYADAIIVQQMLDAPGTIILWPALANALSPGQLTVMLKHVQNPLCNKLSNCLDFSDLLCGLDEEHSQIICEALKDVAKKIIACWQDFEWMLLHIKTPTIRAMVYETFEQHLRTLPSPDALTQQRLQTLVPHFTLAANIQPEVIYIQSPIEGVAEEKNSEPEPQALQPKLSSHDKSEAYMQSAKIMLNITIGLSLSMATAGGCSFIFLTASLNILVNLLLSLSILSGLTTLGFYAASNLARPDENHGNELLRPAT